jgi:hypothetical protein
MRKCLLLVLIYTIPPHVVLAVFQHGGTIYFYNVKFANVEVVYLFSRTELRCEAESDDSDVDDELRGAAMCLLFELMRSFSCGRCCDVSWSR